MAAAKDIAVGTVNLFAWAIAFTAVWAVTQPVMKSVSGFIIGLRHKGGNGPNGGV